MERQVWENEQEHELMQVIRGKCPKNVTRDKWVWKEND